MATDQKLNRTMTLVPAISTVMGTVIGAGVFYKASSVASATGSTSMSLFVWLLGGLISLAAGLTGAELAAALPQTGGILGYQLADVSQLASRQSMITVIQVTMFFLS